MLAAIQGRTTKEICFAGQPAPDILPVVCDLLWLLARAVGSDFYIQHSFEGSYFRPHYRWERPPKDKPWLDDLRIRDRRSVLATLAQLVDSGLNRKIFHDSRRLLLPGIRHLYPAGCRGPTETPAKARSLPCWIPISCLESPGRLGVYLFPGK